MPRQSRDLRTFIIYMDEDPICLITATSKSQATAMILPTLKEHLRDKVERYMDKGWPEDRDVVPVELDELGGTIL